MIRLRNMTAKRKIGLTITFSLILLVLFAASWLTLRHEKRAVSWSPDTIIEIKTHTACIFVDPNDAYQHVTLDRNKLVPADMIHSNFFDCKIDANNIVVAYINSKSPKELVFQVIAQGNETRQTVLKILSNKQLYAGAYPKIYITDKAYYVAVDLNSEADPTVIQTYLYKIDKTDFKTEEIQLEGADPPLLTSDRDLFLRKGQFLTKIQNNSDKKVLKLAANEIIKGWGIEGQTIIIRKWEREKRTINQTEMIFLKDGAKTKLRYPSYGSLDVIGNMGHICVIEFYHTSGEVPLFDPSLFAYSILDGTDYWYYHPYLYDAEKDEYYDIPDEIKDLYPNKNVALTGYSAPINLKQIESKWNRYVANTSE
ncbi:hypothetical protein [uncultured Megasphaera sp.]|uniref:hypothetical protein n=1 Tax=uncultured Megasphaera sp. TaxID=165188 RepID=UPI002586217D|nr:hypothetical protein [uncultured Megasphaera sp.]